MENCVSLGRKEGHTYNYSNLGRGGIELETFWWESRDLKTAPTIPALGMHEKLDKLTVHSHVLFEILDFNVSPDT